MNQTEDIKDLVAAISQVQGKMKPAKFNKKNSHFKSGYADYSSCMDACRELLSEHGLSVLQYCETVNNQLCLATMIAHISGQWLKAYIPLHPEKMNSQGIGSAITYAKRYGLSAMLGIVTGEEDDDGEASVDHTVKPSPKSPDIDDPCRKLRSDINTEYKKFDEDKIKCFMKELKDMRIIVADEKNITKLEKVLNIAKDLNEGNYEPTTKIA